MAKVYGTMSVDCRLVKEIEVDDPKDIEQIREKMEEAFLEADIGELKCVDGGLIAVEDESGNFIYEA